MDIEIGRDIKLSRILITMMKNRNNFYKELYIQVFIKKWNLKFNKFTNKTQENYLHQNFKNLWTKNFKNQVNKVSFPNIKNLNKYLIRFQE